MPELDLYIVSGLETYLIHNVGLLCFFCMCVLYASFNSLPLSSRGLCFMKCVLALQTAEVHLVTVPLAMTQCIICHFGGGLFLRLALVSFLGISVLS